MSVLIDAGFYTYRPHKSIENNSFAGAFFRLLFKGKDWKFLQ